MAKEEELIKIDGMEEALKNIDFLSSFKINDQYLVPDMKRIGGAVRKEERKHIPTFSGSTQRNISSRVTTNGIGSVTADIGPSKGGKSRAYILWYINGGAQWHDRASTVTTWRGREQNRKARADKRVAAGGKANPSYLPAKYLVNWVKKKLGAGDADALHVAFRVAKSIGRSGLKARPVLPPTLAAVTNMVTTEINNTIHRMVEELGRHGK